MSIENKIFKKHSDAGHGWLAVKKSDVEKLGLTQNSFTSYSYVRGQTLYLEEDLDAMVFYNNFVKKYGKTPNIKYGKFYDRSPIRSYQYLES